MKRKNGDEISKRWEEENSQLALERRRKACREE